MAARSPYYVCTGGNRTYYFVLLCIHERHNKPVNTLVSQHPYFAFRIHFPSFSNHHSLQLCCFVRSGSHVTMATDKRDKTSCKKNVSGRRQRRLSTFFKILQIFFSLRHPKIRTQKASCRMSLMRKKTPNQLS